LKTGFHQQAGTLFLTMYVHMQKGVNAFGHGYTTSLDLNARLVSS
jgi:hypothetical protein